MSTPTTVVGLLHPGAMGAAVGRVLAANPGRQVLWASEGRSPESVARADQAGLADVGTLAAVVEGSEAVLSICPPEAALAQARSVAELGFPGLYVDANAVSPDTARRAGALFSRYVDGGIVGPPPTGPGLTRLYLAGDEAPTVAGWFDDTLVEARRVDSPPGGASAVKMGYAAWTKGTSALLVAIRALAAQEGISQDLLGEWATSLPDLVGRSEGVAGATGPKAWRFEGEMHEIADTFAAAGLPDQFHRGAAEIYRRLAPLKGTTNPTLDQALDLLAGNG